MHYERLTEEQIKKRFPGGEELDDAKKEPATAPPTTAPPPAAAP
jgi:hypothetical protein